MISMCGETLSAAETGGGGGCEQRAVRRRVILLVTVFYALTQLVGGQRVSPAPYGDDASSWTYGIGSDDEATAFDVDWRAAALAHQLVVATGDDSPEIWRPIKTAYRRNRRRTKAVSGGMVSGKFLSRSPWKRRSVLGLDNLDYAASMLEMARSHHQSRLHGGGDRGLATSGSHGRSTLVTGADGGGESEVETGSGPMSTNLGGSSARGDMSNTARFSGLRRAGQPGLGRLSLKFSPQDVRKLMDIVNAGRRR